MQKVYKIIATMYLFQSHKQFTRETFHCDFFELKAPLSLLSSLLRFFEEFFVGFTCFEFWLTFCFLIACCDFFFCLFFLLHTFADTFIFGFDTLFDEWLYFGCVFDYFVPLSTEFHPTFETDLH